MYVGLVDDQAIQGNFASPPGIDAQTSVHFVGCKERFGAGGLQPMNFEALQGGAQRKPIDGDGS